MLIKPMSATAMKINLRVTTPRKPKTDNVNADKRNEAEAGDRNEDNDTVDIRHDFTDWSGTSPLLWEIDFDKAGRIMRHNQEYDKKI